MIGFNQFHQFSQTLTLKKLVFGYLLTVVLGFISVLPMLLVNYCDNNSSTLVKRDETNEYANCTLGTPCGNGRCWSDSDSYNDNSTHYCQCFENYITVAGPGVCQYHQISTLVAFMVAVFFGMCGAEWCLIAQGNGLYIFLGFLKALTFGGCFIWYFLDIILIYLGALPDGNGEPLGSDSTH